MPRSRCRRIISLIASFDMLPRPGISCPLARSPFARRLLMRPSSARVWSFIRLWRMTGSSSLPLALASSLSMRPAPRNWAPPPRLRRLPTKSPTRLSRCPATVPGNAALAAAWPPPAPSPARSNARVVLVTAQPLLRSPISASVVVRASVRNTSLNSARPVISFSGRMSTPGWCMSRAK